MPHTPGPWAVVGIDELNGVDPDLCEPDALVVANLNAETREAAVVCDLWSLAGGGEKRHEELANANLIAAAPEMYAFIKELLTGDDWSDAARSRLTSLGWAALDKAEGR